MRFRPFNHLLLASLLFWTSGAALYVHERMEHEGAGESAVVETDSSHPDKHHDPHNHDDCPKCQLLAHMNAERVAPPALICVHLPAFATLPMTDRLAPTVESRPSAPIRGPPIMAARFA